jgi:K+-transporting ATPase KdpF subunit
MSWLTFMVAAVALGLLVYLVTALLLPERFS